jgi:Ca2+:H+ antiporter
VARRILTGSLALGPIVILLHYFGDIGEEAEFALAALALIPLAWLIGEATEHASHHTGAGVGGFLNATFGNAPELIIALIAVNEGLTEVVRGSLTGSVVGNLLLVLGFSLALGGRGELDRSSSYTSLALVAFAVVLFLIPSIPGWEGDPDRHGLAVASLVISIVLLIVYLAVTWVSLRRHRVMHVSDEAAVMLVLGIATLITALVAEVLVGSIEVFAETVGLSEFFVAAVIVAIVGNAAEHGGAVVIARRGNIKLAAEIALASSAQVAVFLIPVVAIISWAIDPLSLAFRPVELSVLAAATLLTAILLRDGRSTTTKGVVLIIGYGLAALAFFLVGDRTF